METFFVTKVSTVFFDAFWGEWLFFSCELREYPCKIHARPVFLIPIFDL